MSGRGIISLTNFNPVRDPKMGRKIDKQIVYEYLAAIPKGKVVTYSQIAVFLGDKNFARSVGNILHINPDGDKYPCYKVVNSRGSLAENYAFGGADGQRLRLEADGITVSDNRVDLKVYQWDEPDHERLQRIIKMERCFDEVLEAKIKNPELLRSSEKLRDQIGLLGEYYQSGSWLRDYESDERGELPRNLKRGVLSQDALYDLFSEMN